MLSTRQKFDNRENAFPDAKMHSPPPGRILDAIIPSPRKSGPAQASCTRQKICYTQASVCHFDNPIHRYIPMTHRNPMMKSIRPNADWPYGLPWGASLIPNTNESLQKRLLRNLAAQDWLISLYFVLLFLAVLFGSGSGRAQSLQYIGMDIAILWAGLLTVRSELVRPSSFLSSIIYRASLVVPVVLSYFQLRHILPAASGRAVDAAILKLDLWLFGFEPSIQWDALVTPITIEWFSFFYFSYFVLLPLFVSAFLFFVRDRSLIARFSFGLFGIFCTAHLVYILVPGYGPYKHLAGSFHHELQGGIFWKAVWEVVQAGGAMKDIFPSLHTAVPTYFALFAFHHRKQLVFKLLFPILAVFASQIIIATMFLRWHWLLDIFAGITLASAAHLFSLKVHAWESSVRAQIGARSVFDPLPLPMVSRASQNRSPS